MNDYFLALPEEKQQRIINAGLEIFAQDGYQKGNTERIAQKAGISKGSLFYYFKNKEAFYLYLCQFCEQQFQKEIEAVMTIPDFFDRIEYGTQQKMKINETYPFMAAFSLRFVIGDDKKNEVADDYTGEMLLKSYDMYFNGIDQTRFKNEIQPQEIYQMLLWMAEGYLIDRQRLKQEVDVQEFVETFKRWTKMFKQVSYKEDYQ